MQNGLRLGSDSYLMDEVDLTTTPKQTMWGYLCVLYIRPGANFIELLSREFCSANIFAKHFKTDYQPKYINFTCKFGWYPRKSAKQIFLVSNFLCLAALCNWPLQLWPRFILHFSVKLLTIFSYIHRSWIKTIPRQCRRDAVLSAAQTATKKKRKMCQA